MSSPAVPSVNLTKATPVNLRDAGLSESWLEDVIEKDPTILGLGDLTVRDKQRRQEKAGRLDLLLEDDLEERRYELELMLGSTDESHIIRTIEYWDIERRKYPGYEHCAVLLAEDITTRFLNVISLFSGSVPIIVIQISALKVEDKMVLNFVKILDSRKLRKDDSTEVKARTTDLQYWISKSSAATVELADRCLEIINKVAASPRKFSYNKSFIGLNDGIRPGNFVTFKPKKSFLRLKFEALGPLEPWVKVLEKSGIEFDVKNDDLRVVLTAKDFEDNKELMTTLLQEAVKEYETD